MIYLVLPRGNNFGWGVCGKYLVKEISDITDVKFITDSFSVEEIGDEYEFHFLKSKLLNDTEARAFSGDGSRRVGSPVLQAIGNQALMPWGTEINSPFKAGYTFFEENILKQEYIQNGKDNFDIVITGSKWCEEVLRNHGLDNVETVIQGVDQQIFNTYHSDKEIFKDNFVIFSGGKFEIRKGQDIVIKAYKVLQDRHKDVMLVNAWFNMWGDSMNTMAASRHIKYDVKSKDYATAMYGILQDNGLDMERIVTLLPRSNALMAKIYKNTDIGLFTNRCEGGTNLVLMEYMACGKPVIASYNSGHRDVINKDNSIMINNMRQIDINKNGTKIAVWDDPDLDETISHLEWAYQHRDELKSYGTQAGNDLKELTWKKSAAKFVEIIEGSSQGTDAKKQYCAV